MLLEEAASAEEGSIEDFTDIAGVEEVTTTNPESPKAEGKKTKARSIKVRN